MTLHEGQGGMTLAASAQEIFDDAHHLSVTCQ